MVFKRFSINIALRILLLFASLCGLAFSLTQTIWVITPFIIAAGIILIVTELIRYVQKTNRDLSKLLLSIRHNDFGSNFTSGDRGSSFHQLQSALNSIVTDFRNIRTEKEVHHQYLQTVVEHVTVALICLDEQGEVILLNQQARNMLHRPYIKNIDSLERSHPTLLRSIRELESGQKDLVKILSEDHLLHLAVSATKFKLQDKAFKLVSLQNIKTELEENEVEAWQKLIRVLTHEIMNSVTPIISLSSLINRIVADAGEAPLGEEELEDVRAGLLTIESRSKGLLEFVQSYRKLTKVPKPEFAEVNVRDLLHRIHILLKPETDREGISLQILMTDEKLCIQADANLIEQVLINLIKNAREALKDTPEPKIELIATPAPGKKILLQVCDNGPGIKDEFIDKIFIPFFTTKENGSGIGLSLSRQIMRMHKGSISVISVEGKRTVFTLEF